MNKTSKRRSKNVFEKRAEALQEHDRARKRMSGHRAPYISTSWLQRFFDVNRIQRIDNVDKEFVRLHIIGSGNESKVISALRFLELIDDDGNATSKLASLRVIGDEFKRNLSAIVKDAYGDLVSTIVLDIATPETLVNFFVQRYDYSQKLAWNATRLFVWLAYQSDMAISKKLSDLTISPRPRTIPRRAEKNLTLPSKLRPRARKVKKAMFERHEPAIQATVNILLDKDTPRDLWDRVLALLGEKREEK